MLGAEIPKPQSCITWSAQCTAILPINWKCRNLIGMSLKSPCFKHNIVIIFMHLPRVDCSTKRSRQCTALSVLGLASISHHTGSVLVPFRKASWLPEYVLKILYFFKPCFGTFFGNFFGNLLLLQFVPWHFPKQYILLQRNCCCLYIWIGMVSPINVGWHHFFSVPRQCFGNI